MKEYRQVLSRLISYSTKKIINCISSAKRKEKHFYFQQLECNGMT
jgi:hypothetical protein